MDGGTRLFWAMLAVLLGMSAYFGTAAEQKRRAIQKASASVETGELVTLASVIDGDSVLVKNAAGDEVTVRVLGVKALEAAPGKDPFAPYAKAAENSLRRELSGKRIRVLLGSPAKDKHGRTLATLFVDDHDVGLSLVAEGAALVYTAYPFPAMQGYLDAQTQARAAQKGLWADPAARERASALLRRWSEEAP